MANLLAVTITAALTAQLSPVVQLVDGSPRNLLVQGNLTYGTSGGTTIDAWVQSSIDGGASWCDMCNFHFTTASARKVFNLSSQTPVTTIATPTDGSLAANTAVDGIVGTQLRVKWTSAGTYVGATVLSVDVNTTRALH
jgi:hypothetical protein